MPMAALPAMCGRDRPAPPQSPALPRGRRGRHSSGRRQPLQGRCSGYLHADHWQAQSEEPFLVVKVISESSERDDFGLEAHRYGLLWSVQEIWLVDSRKRSVQVWQRTQDAWIVTLPLRGSASFASQALDDRIELDALYRNSDL